ncbi:hypothetical protein [Caldicellulosiruptor acetigenus]|uniref:CRISPR type III-B/RAMP module-associated protein Cmr5 n=1 Tax=Caldicellulosiruptor acetigenus 6A TaxID=632516 RepID=G2PYR1_9FIRM|nr:hypothetical protein [Caldicellulosiruptor acetigenus]AEM74980.1 hypothetical protein Calla_2454 [Caldicellulosiruptor acetigenus 6A]
MKEEARKEIIKMLVQWADKIGENKNFWKQNRELGKTNIRTTATAILQASCYNEVKLFLEYKGSRKNTGWDKLFNNNTTFANYIISKIEDLRKKVDEKYKEDPTFDKEKEVIELAARFLGYIYWKIYGLVNQKENEERQPQNSNQSPQMKGTNYQGRSGSRQSRS